MSLQESLRACAPPLDRTRSGHGDDLPERSLADVHTKPVWWPPYTSTPTRPRLPRSPVPTAHWSPTPIKHRLAQYHPRNNHSS